MVDISEARLNKYRAQLDEWAAQLDELKAMAEKKDAAAKIELEKRINELELKYVALREKVRQMDSAVGEARKKLGKGVEEAYDDLSKVISETIKGFVK